MYYIGIDLGTSAVKLLLMEGNGKIVRVTSWPGKSDLYHAVQATLIPFYTADLSIAPAVKGGKFC